LEPINGMSTVVPLQFQQNNKLLTINNPESEESEGEKMESVLVNLSDATKAMVCREILFVDAVPDKNEVDKTLTPVKPLTPAKYDFVIPKFKSQF
jgi:DNA polymerase IIIc chi subunit